MKNKIIDLGGEWRLCGQDNKGVPFDISATVPGCVHTDLLRCGMISDPYYRDNSKLCLWIEENNFTYVRRFSLDEVASNTYLEFEGIDTYGEIYLNGKLIGKCSDMFIPYEYSVSDILRKGENILEVHFKSPIKSVEGKPSRKGCFTTERLYTRREQCTYGWDWVDRFVTMGIYKDVRLYVREENEIDNFYLVTKSINNFSVEMELSVNIRDFAPVNEKLFISVCDPDGKEVFCRERCIIKEQIKERFHIAEPRLWFPSGYGDQPLYTLTLETQNSKIKHSFGIRTISVLEIEDKEGSYEKEKCRTLQSYPDIAAVDKNEKTAGFTLLVNGRRIMCKGGNWVPSEPFASEFKEEKIARLLSLAKSAGVNMLRVWGGGLFESDFFYEECTRLGIAVTQDFLMACGNYPEEEEWFISALREEAHYAALKLRNHTSLVWWSGDNENAVDGNDNITDYPGYISAEKGISPILAMLDPSRLFLASSPYGGDRYSSVTRGTCHVSNFLGDIYKYVLSGDLSDLRERLSFYQGRFIAEQPTMGMPFLSTLKKFLTDEDIFGENTDMSEFHTKHNPDLGEISIYSFIDNFTRKVFGEYKNGEDRLLKMQMLQCEWLRFAFEQARRAKWFNSGILFWMYNDCWPAANGWSLVDYYSNPKPSYYSFKRCAKPIIASIEKSQEEYRVYVCNDGLKKTTVKGRAYIHDILAGNDIFEWSFELEAPEEASLIALSLPAASVNEKLSDGHIIMADIEYENGSDRAYFIDERYKDYRFEYSYPEIVSCNEEFVVIRSEKFNPCALVDLPYVLEENGIPMKKLETRKIRILSKNV